MYPAPSDAEIALLLERHRLPFGRVEISPYEGSVNHVRMIGDLCIRVLKQEDYASDLYTESVCVPPLARLGVATPELLIFDDSRSVVPSAVTIYRRSPGIPIGECTRLPDETTVVDALGLHIARWVNGLEEIDDPNGWLDRPSHHDLSINFGRAAERMTPPERAWTEAAIQRLRQAVAPASAFVHWDLHRHNILVYECALQAVIDWGDAGWGDPTINYHALPAEWLPRLLSPLGDVDHHFVGRCLYGILGYALNDIHREARGTSPYSHTGHARWESIRRLILESRDDRIRQWLPVAPPTG